LALNKPSHPSDPSVICPVRQEHAGSGRVARSLVHIRRLGGTDAAVRYVKLQPPPPLTCSAVPKASLLVHGSGRPRLGCSRRAVCDGAPPEPTGGCGPVGAASSAAPAPSYPTVSITMRARRGPCTSGGGWWCPRLLRAAPTTAAARVCSPPHGSAPTPPHALPRPSAGGWQRTLCSVDGPVTHPPCRVSMGGLLKRPKTAMDVMDRSVVSFSSTRRAAVRPPCGRCTPGRPTLHRSGDACAEVLKGGRSTIAFLADVSGAFFCGTCPKGRYGVVFAANVCAIISAGGWPEFFTPT